MSAAANLMGLVTQLQNMECAISSIIMESAMKLASLTSASIFVVIETEDARRFTGSPHMMQTYLERNMIPSGRDLQIDVDLGARIVHEHPPAYQQPPFMTTNNGAGTSSTELALTTPSTSTAPQQQQRPSKPFMKRPAIGPPGGSGESTPSTPPKRSKSIDSPLMTPKIEDQKPEVSADGSVTNPESSSIRTLEDIAGAVTDVVDDDDDSDIEVLESVSFMESDKIEDSFVNSPASTSNSSALMSMSAGASVDRRLDNQSFVPVDVSQNQMKIDALRSIENPLLAFQKGNIEFRLLTSVFYDKGKEIGQKCPFPSDQKMQTKMFFERNFKSFLQTFPELVCDSDLSKKAFIEYGNAKYTVEAFMRINARNGFRRGLLLTS